MILECTMTHLPTAKTEAWMRYTVFTRVGPLAVWERGHGAAVVLRHGIFFDHTMWDHQAELLAHNYRVIVIDAPGHGDSGDPSRAYSLADDAQATIQILDFFGLDAAVLIGHSWGGMSAVRTALAAPDRVRALALINTPLESSSMLGRLRYALLCVLMLLLGLPRWYSAQITKTMFSDTSRRNNPTLTRSLQLRLAASARLPLARAMDAVLVRADTVLDHLGSLTQPVMVLAGDEDYVLPQATRDALASLVSQASIATIAGKHVLPLEQPVETGRRLEQFLTEVEP
ncbi:MAG: alpha/beta fold hydrolase [Rhodoglobus sp.]